MRDEPRDPHDETLIFYPYVVVRIACDCCGRRGAYRLTRLVYKFGLNARLENILRRLIDDCPYVSDPRGKRPHRLLPDEMCEAYFPDFEPPQQPPDLPPPPKIPLRIVRGGGS